MNVFVVVFKSAKNIDKNRVRFLHLERLWFQNVYLNLRNWSTMMVQSILDIWKIRYFEIIQNYDSLKVYLLNQWVGNGCERCNRYLVLSVLLAINDFLFIVGCCYCFSPSLRMFSRWFAKNIFVRSFTFHLMIIAVCNNEQNNNIIVIIFLQFSQPRNGKKI